MSKSELIKQHKSGILKDMAVHTIANSLSAVIVSIDYDMGKVFGYLSSAEGSEYFSVKLKTTPESYTFKVGNLTFDIRQFMRV